MYGCEYKGFAGKGFFLPSKATLKAARKQFQAALQDAEVAILRNPPLHEILAQYIDILIELRRFEDAQAKLDEVSQKFKGRNARDTQLGLRCKLELRQGRWREADAFFPQLHRKDFPVHQGLLREILRQKAQDRTISGKDKQEARAAMDKIEVQQREADQG